MSHTSCIVSKSVFCTPDSVKKCLIDSLSVLSEVNGKPRRGEARLTALMLMAKHRQHAAAELLLRAGADVRRSGDPSLDAGQMSGTPAFRGRAPASAVVDRTHSVRRRETFRAKGRTFRARGRTFGRKVSNALNTIQKT